MKRYDMLIMIPLIVLSGLTSITAITQLIGVNLPLQIVTIVFSLLVTILASSQKYLEFDKRSISAKQVAKRWGSVKGKVDFFILNLTGITDHAAILIILNSIFNEMDSIGGTLEDVPDKIVSDEVNNLKTFVIQERKLYENYDVRPERPERSERYMRPERQETRF